MYVIILEMFFFSQKKMHLQERLWKIAAAAQLGHQTAFTCRSRFEKLNRQLETKILSHRIAKAVMQFWHSAKLLLDNDLGINCIVGCVESGKVDANEALRDQRRNSNMVLIIFSVLFALSTKETVLFEFDHCIARFLQLYEFSF